MIDLSNFKLLKEDDNNYEIGHPNGKKLTVEKKGLSDKAHKAILALKESDKKMSDGGETEDDATDPRVVDDPLRGPLSTYEQSQVTAPPQEEKPVTELPFNMEQDTREQMAAQGTPMPDQQVLPQAGGAPQGVDPYAQNFQNMIDIAKQQQGVLTGEQQKMANAAGAQQKAVKELTDQAAQSNKNYQNLFKENQAQSEAFMQHMRDNPKLDPNRLYSNMDTGSKITSAIALMLGGIAQGMHGGENPAMQVMNNAIQRDVQAQMQDRSDKMNLFKMNQENLHDNMQAALATQSQLYTIAKFKLEAAQGQVTSAQAQAGLQMSKLGIDQQISQLNLNRSLMADNTVDPVFKIPYLVKDPVEQKAAIAAVGRLKELAQLKAQDKAAFDSAASETEGNPPMMAKNAVYPSSGLRGLQATGLGINTIMGSKRINELVQNTLNKDLTPGISHSENIERLKSRQNIIDNAGAAEMETLKAHGINVQQWYNQLQTQQYQPGQYVKVKDPASGKEALNVVNQDRTLTPVKL